MLWILFSGFYVAARRQRKADHETRSGGKRPPPGKHSRAEIKGTDAAHRKKKDRQSRSSFTEGENVADHKNACAERHQHGVIVVIRGQNR
jgi:hypothetical protein